MKKLHLILFLNCYLCTLFSMEDRETSLSNMPIDVSGTYLAHLPADVDMYIAQYLPFFDRENDQEFIQRSSSIVQGDTHKPIEYKHRKAQIEVTKKKIPYTYCSLTLENIKRGKQYLTIHTKKDCPTNHFFSYSPDYSKLIYVADKAIYCIYDEQSKKITDYPIGHVGEIVAITLSSCAKYVAIVYKSLASSSYIIKLIYDGFFEYHTQLKLKTIKSVSFNMQGTQVIVHDATDNYEIFPLVNADMCKNQKKIEYYFHRS